ncbi:nitrogen fixation negative regulator NifL [Corallincola luteus]|uniref:histidine kinase n=3 Tax=Psychromonadaceae TaxID=267894 RepID=A0ABY1WU92_9GAMM|nr:nitrogen fixation negative regulator NifL [Corallincola spongiicola]TCI02449.1 nitrogen fixation negative regulator NifL [Corallincola luteus]
MSVTSHLCVVEERMSKQQESAVIDMTPFFNGEVGSETAVSQFIQTVEQAPMAISITDTDANILYVNPWFCQTTGYGLQEIKGENHSILSYRTTPAEVYQGLWNQLKKGRSWQGRLINRRKNGERYLADVIVTPLTDGEGETTHFLGIHRDVTETHELTTKLINQKTLVEAVLNAAPVAIALLDENQQVVLDNLSYKALAADFQQEPAKQIIAKLKEELGENATEQLRTRRFVEGHSLSLELKQSRGERWFYCKLSGFSAADSGVDDYFAPTASDYLVLTISEHTKEKRHQEQQRVSELQRMTAESEMMHVMQETLHAAIHQMQGPINMIEAAVTVLTGRSGKCPGLEAMEMALKSGADAVDQLRDALPDRPQEAQQPVNINQLVHDVAALSTQRLLKTSIPMQLKLTATLPSINGQPSRLRVAIKQLLDNAIDAIEFGKPQSREIEIQTYMDDESVVVLIDDSGPGVPQANKIKAFQPFYSTKPVASNGARGVGLSIVQQVMNEHCGSTLLQRSPLGGCRAVISLPRRERDRS